MDREFETADDVDWVRDYAEGLDVVDELGFLG